MTATYSSAFQPCFVLVPLLSPIPQYQARACPRRPELKTRASGGPPPQRPPQPPARRRRPLAARAASLVLNVLIRSMAEVEGELDVDVDAVSNVDLLSGRLRGVSVSAARVVFDGLSISGGCSLFVQSLTLPQNDPFAVSVSCVVTEADLNVRSSPVFLTLEELLQGVVGAGLSGIVVRMAQADGGSQGTVLERVALEGSAGGKGGRLVLSASTLLRRGVTLRYILRTGLSIARDGTALEFSSPEVEWRSLPLPLLPFPGFQLSFAKESKITSLDLTAEGLFVEGILVVTPPSSSSSPPPPRLSGGGGGPGGWAAKG